MYVNPPMITKGKFTEAILSGFPFYPSRLEYENAQSDKTKFEWFVSTEKFPPNEAASDSKKAKPVRKSKSLQGVYNSFLCLLNVCLDQNCHSQLFSLSPLKEKDPVLDLDFWISVTEQGEPYHQ